RDKIRVWRHITPSNDMELFRALLLEAKGEGFTAVRINPCRDMEGMATSKRLSTMYNRIAFAREVLGDEIDIAIEIHRELNGDESLMLCKMLEELNILFFEDPIRSENVETLKDFTAKTVVPIAAGERCISIQEFEMMLNAGMRIARPDVCTLGGFTGSMKVCALAEAHHAYIVPHVPVSVINIAASLHMASVIPNFLIMETFPPKTFKQALDCMGDYKFKLKDGYMEIPDGPGWGIELADNVGEIHPYVTIPWRLDQHNCYGGADTTNKTTEK
ncbi:MAG: mandelate racemase/muconate lactonizing enzyme family protein, partial [Clostridia bacterium]|nr:mandelate racemase/muconate lactonizing enzyme family protein [Clostridia bacterium]